MGTVEDKLSLLSQTKSNIRNVIVNKGQEVLDTDPFSSYASKIEAIQTGGGGGDPLDPESVYNATKPSDWLPMPDPQDDELYLLFHIPDGVSSLLAFTTTCTGQYTVSLGTVTNGEFVSENSVNVDSETKYETELFADDYGNLTSDGFKQVMVKISGTNILTWKPSTHTKHDGYSNWCIVEMKGKLPSATKIVCGSSNNKLALVSLKYFSIVGSNKITNMSSMFYSCNSLTAIPQLDTSSVTSMSNMFYSCNSLTAIPQLDTSSVTSMNSMFSTCYSLTTIPQLDTSSVTDMISMFLNCNSLTTIPQLDTSSVTSMNSMFLNCYSLTTIPQLDTSSVTDMSSMFNSCRSLITIPQLDTSSVTSMNYMFNSCRSLITIPQLDTSSVTSMNSMFSSCYSLKKLIFNPTITNWPGVSISLLDCSLGEIAIVDLFNSLPFITSSKAITLTGNPGVSELTDADRLIATEKGWTLTL